MAVSAARPCSCSSSALAPARADQHDPERHRQGELALARRTSTMAVVSTRVCPSMLPPTSITAPTSEMMPPNARRRSPPSRRPAPRAGWSSRSATARRPALGPGGGRSGSTPSTALIVRRGHQRERDDGLRHDHGGGREQPPERVQRPASREEQVDDEADDDRRQPHAGVERQGDEPLPAEPDEAEHRAQRHAEQRRDDSAPGRSRAA